MQDKKLLALAAAIADPAEHDPGDAPIAISAGLADWLLVQQISLAFTSYPVSYTHLDVYKRQVILSYYKFFF